MGLTRRTVSTLALGAVEFCSDRELMARNTKRTPNPAREAATW
jgi:hypothetical protein